MTTDSHVLTAEQETQETMAAAATRPPRLFLPALLSAGLLWLSYFPIGWGILGWVALVPVLTLVRAPASRKRRYFAAWLCGLLFYWPVLQWMRLADDRMYATWAILATYGSCYVPVAIFLIRRLERTRMSLVLSVPLVWTALEFIRANFGGGFAWYILGHPQHDIPGGYAWYFLGHSQHAFIPLIQVADLGGAFAVTFVVAAANALIFSLCLQSAKLRSLVRLPEESRLGWFAPAFVAVLMAGTMIYGTVRLAQQDDVPGPRLALLQGNIDQRIRLEAGADPGAAGTDGARRVIEDDYSTLLAAATSGPHRPELIIWPESAYPAEWIELSPAFPLEQLPKSWPELFEKLAQGRMLPAGMTLRDYWQLRENNKILSDIARWQTPMLLGLNTTVITAKDRSDRYNTALYLPALPGQAGLPYLLQSQRYDKIHRVPFGEYIPFRETLPWLNSFAPYDYEYAVLPGAGFTRFPLGDYRFGVLICFEDTDPNLARQYARDTADGPAADFLVNISNDGWFIGSAEHDEHLALCRFRAVECRRSVARAVNMGISAIIDGSGRIVALPAADWPSSKSMAGVVLAQVPIDRRHSPYAVLGDAFGWLCVAGLAAGLLWSLRRSPSTSQERG